jgi:hypothetical protein
MDLSRFFIDRPIFASVVSIFIFIAGLLAMLRLPVSEYPEVVPPSVQVRTQFPGANPQVLADTVAAPLEENINGVEDMLYMSSQSTADGSYQLTITFKVGTDIDRAERLAPPAGGSATHRRGGPEELAQPHPGGEPDLARRPLRRAVPAQLRGPQHQEPPAAHRRHGPGGGVRRR